MRHRRLFTPAPGPPRGGPPKQEPEAPRSLSPSDIIAGVPDPVILLNRHGIVIAFNALAGVLAPALREGQPLSLGLRMPAVVEAIRAAAASGEAQRAEF